jgi:hypothetical protein
VTDGPSRLWLIAENRMKLNFWQWLGVIIIAGALILIGYREITKRSNPPMTPPATQTVN